MKFQSIFYNTQYIHKMFPSNYKWITIYMYIADIIDIHNLYLV